MINCSHIKGSFFERNYLYLICKTITTFQRWLKVTEKKTLYTRAKCCTKTLIKEAENKVDKVVHLLKDEVETVSNIIVDKKTKITPYIEEIVKVFLDLSVSHYIIISILLLTILALLIFLWNRKFYLSKVHRNQELSPASLLRDSASFLIKAASTSSKTDASHIVKTANINLDNSKTVPPEQIIAQKSDLNFELQDKKRNREIDENLKKKLNEAVQVVSQLEDITDWNFNFKKSSSVKGKSIENEVEYVEKKTTAAKNHLAASH